jgi:hypothetical protein
MNLQLVESLTKIINSLTPEEQELLNQKINYNIKKQETPFYEIATHEERAEAFIKWAENHDQDTPLLSDYAVSRAGIYKED